MWNVQLGWPQATVLAAVLLGAAWTIRKLTARRFAPFQPYLHEAGIISAVYALWQGATQVSVFGTEGALSRGHWIVRVEHDAYLPHEQSIQQLLLDSSVLAWFCDWYYAIMHFLVLGIFLVWMFARHRGQYRKVRTVLVVSTAISLLIQFFPVAPPRMLIGLGFVDVAAARGESVYQLTAVTVDELAAMPSVHVLWALLIAWAVMTVSTSRWRWISVAHFVVTIFVVVGTANHFWLDGIAAAGIFAASLAVVNGVLRWRGGSGLVSEAEFVAATDAAASSFA